MDKVTVMSWLEGLSQDDWRDFHSDSEVQNIAKDALKLLELQEKIINRLQRDVADLRDALSMTL
jgi:hypothetical protein